MQASDADGFLIVEPLPLSGRENMRRDLALLRRVEESSAPLTAIRLYRWEVPTVSLGKHQAVDEAVDADYCRGHSIPIVRRPTGGRAVLHAEELTYAVASNDLSRFAADIMGTYLVIARALQLGLSRGGLRAEIDPGTRSSAPLGGLVPPCFATTSRHELTIQGRKVVGSAQRRTRHGFLQHGAIPLKLDYPMMEAVFRTPAALLKLSFAGLAEVGGHTSFQLWADVLAAAFRETLQLALPKTTDPWPSLSRPA